MKRVALFIIVAIISAGLAASAAVRGEVTVDFLKCLGIDVNAAGPFIVKMDLPRNRLVVANTLSSSVTLIDCETEKVVNIPIGGRGLQHLKAEALAIAPETGRICMIGRKSLHILDPGDQRGLTVDTGVQFESAAVCGKSGNVFLAGRETGGLGFYDSAAGKMKTLKWLEKSEPLRNMNATPPPPRRKVFVDNILGRAVAVDGYTSTIYIFDASNGGALSSRRIPVEPAARWHLAGYDEKSHFLYVALETAARKVIQAAKIDIAGEDDTVVELPGYTEGVGVIYNPERDEVYIPYDNHPSVHVVDFSEGGAVSEIKIPAYGNDATALDEERGYLYVASWAHGEIDVVDIEKRKLAKRIEGLGIIPHMFTMAYGPSSNLIYFPKGGTAVNGTFGAALTAVDPVTEETHKIRTGWAPVDLIETGEDGSFLVFNSEDAFARVGPDGSYDLHSLPVDYPLKAVYGPDGSVYLSYGPHQSYWPVVYIWGARNGVLGIDPETLRFYDRRTVRQALDMALGEDGVLYLSQNNWGKESQFIARLIDEVRLLEPGQRIELADTVQRETTQRILDFDPETDLLYLVKAGEDEDKSGALQIVSPDSGKISAKVPTGLNPTGIAFDSEYICVTGFGSGDITIVKKGRGVPARVNTGGSPLKIRAAEEGFFAIDHTGTRLIKLDIKRLDGLFSKDRKARSEKPFKAYEIPAEGMPDNIFIWNGKPVISVHSPKALTILAFDPDAESFEELLSFEYPFGDVSFDTSNSSFYMSGQFGDAIFSLARMRKDHQNRLWIADFLAGKVFILKSAGRE